MGRMARMAAVVAALAMASVAAQAHAQTAKPKPRAEAPAATAFASDQNSWAPKPRKSLQWAGGGRWALNLDVDQPSTRDVEWKDVEAGASIRITPSLRLGGSVGLGASNEDPRRVTPDEKPQPRVRLETTFRF
ncbi:NtrZ family periplasmic regulatory protein [Caulobacter sp. 17J65-9]|uniref:NtrZ family periplasmic regulatory protein n=1 Tax=Caulobacter sp. 17J65-9 TaxID=2709382 RepID=UPI0013CA97B2|nr:hypothetical protein [Caulobacter sp. 17J65-9]NEX91541.1 hypothetical protein [Caulobacter sp. 17J65-9]